MRSHARIFLIVCVPLLFVLACRKKQTPQAVRQNPVASVPVSISLYPNDPLYFKIQAVGGWMYIDGGINGIVVYRKSEQEFVALERSSTQLPNDPKARVQVQNDNFTLRDTVSGSTWRILDGAVIKGPAEWPLRLYGSTYDGNLLRIVN
ncbi:MAG TPA: hypothetical protein PLQ93_07545 [Bacteroidia bacterium]|nr:hypothetical protein [Bacteroidia bacterium]